MVRSLFLPSRARVCVYYLLPFPAKRLPVISHMHTRRVLQRLESLLSLPFLVMTDDIEALLAVKKSL